MVTQDTINRINELYRKSKAEGLTLSLIHISEPTRP